MAVSRQTKKTMSQRFREHYSRNLSHFVRDKSFQFEFLSVVSFYLLALAQIKLAQDVGDRHLEVAVGLVGTVLGSFLNMYVRERHMARRAKWLKTQEEYDKWR